MLSWKSGCNLVASIASLICVISKRWSFSGLEGQFTDTGSQSRTVLSQKTSGSFGAVKKAADTEFPGDDSAILISLCLPIFEISIPYLTLEILYCHLFEISPSTCSHRCGFLFTSEVDVIFKQNTQVSKERHYLHVVNRRLVGAERSARKHFA